MDVVALQKLLTSTCNMWSGIFLMIHSTVNVHVRNDVMLQDLDSVSDGRHCTCHMHNNRSTTMMDSCPLRDTATTKTADLLHAVYSITFPSSYLRRKIHVSLNRLEILHNPGIFVVVVVTVVVRFRRLEPGCLDLEGRWLLCDDLILA